MDNWTYDNPTKPGLYWRRFDYANHITEAQPKPELVEVVETPYGLKYRLVGKSSRTASGEFYPLYYFGPKQWWGPINVAMPHDS